MKCRLGIDIYGKKHGGDANFDVMSDKFQTYAETALQQHKYKVKHGQ